ncbi:MAG TPA: STAS domain-containing protein [Acidimicrobiales bacterium]|nr:STAS domain-containing protein [Acidimicrobiales bacterium]
MMRLDEIASVTATGGLVMIAGEIDMSSAPTLRQTIEAIEIVSPRFDLSRVTFIDSTGLQLLIDLRHEFGPLQLVAESCAVEGLLKLTGTRSFLIGPSVESDGDRRHGPVDVRRAQ